MWHDKIFNTGNGIWDRVVSNYKVSITSNGQPYRFEMHNSPVQNQLIRRPALRNPNLSNANSNTPHSKILIPGERNS
jgi:hypothetical protein